MSAPESNEMTLLADETALADVGELAGPVTHEVNNLLNNLTLHLAVMQQVGSSDLSADLETIRRHITRLTGVVSRFQRRRQRDRGEAGALDLTHILAAVAAAFPSQSIDLQLADDLPGVRAYSADVRRLCRFLLANAVRAVGPDGPPVILRASRSPHGVRLEVEDAGPT